MQSRDGSLSGKGGAALSKQAKYVFVTGGVVSSLGKGITAASLGRLLKARGLKVSLQKFDPYINVDPGTMSPFQHGEVFVTEDGAETDLDLGHYERFVDEFLSRNSNHTTGSIYNAIIRKERKGEYLGATVQVIPHVTDEIKRRIQRVAQSDEVDVVITEIGGTVGDIESLPFLEAIRQFRNQMGRENVMYVHCTLVPFIEVAGELKTKPTQHSVQELRRIGISPDIVVCRSRQRLDRDIREKIALFADVPVESVISAFDAENIYMVPSMMQEQGLDRAVCERLSLVTGPADMREWDAVVERIKNATGEVRIAIVGKYVQLQDAYLSVVEALNHAGYSPRHQGRGCLGGRRDALPRGGRARAARGRRRADPRRLRRARYRRQDRRGQVRPREQRAIPGNLPGHAGRGRRVRTARGGHGRRQLE